VKLNVRFGVPFGHIQRCSNSIEDAHLINMSTFEADEASSGTLSPASPTASRSKWGPTDPPEIDLVALPLIA